MNITNEQKEMAKQELKDQMEEAINKQAKKDLEKKQDAMKEIMLKAESTKLKDVYSTVEKWLGIKEIDRDRIDLILAAALSNQLKGTPIWIFIVGPSGDWKTTFVRSLEGLDNCIKIDQLTKNTLATGQKDADDLGGTLQKSSHILLFLDLASLTSANREDKNIIWGQFRTLYDGDIFKRTGSGVNKAYENCHVTIIACTTESIRDEILIHSQLGTRELMYDTSPDPIDNCFKMDKAWENEQYEQEMKDEFQNVVITFLRKNTIKEIEISEEIKGFLKEEANRLTILRASGAVDRTHRELINPIYPEVPSRLIKQLKRIYLCLKSLEENYPDEKAKRIISHIIDSSGDKVRRMVLELLKNQFDKWFKISEVQQLLRLGRKSVKTQLEQLWNLNVIEREVREERIGGYVHTDSYTGTEEIRGGRVEDVFYYKYIL